MTQGYLWIGLVGKIEIEISPYSSSFIRTTREVWLLETIVYTSCFNHIG